MPPKSGPLLGDDGKKLIRRLAASFAECANESKNYGACLKVHYEAVQHAACEKEFQALQQCFRKQISKARARGK